MEDNNSTPIERHYLIKRNGDDGNVSVLVGAQLRTAFKQLVARGAQLWPDAPWQVKELVDMITEGKPMQDYEALYGRPQQSLAARAKEYAATIVTTAQEHAAMVKRLTKPGDVLLSAMTAKKMDLIHGAVGVSGEAGELLDAVKKHCVYNKDLDHNNVIEELGDLEFYMEMVRANLGISREETLRANIEKLDKKRYKDGYSDAAAIARADKATVFDPCKPDPVEARQSYPSSQSPGP